MWTTSFTRTIASVLFMLVAALPVQVRAETPVGSNVDSRVLVGLKVSAQGVQQMLPEGWVSMSFPGGPLKGANVLLVFIDREIDLDPEGKLKTPSASRALAIVGLAKQTDGEAVHLYVMRIYSTVPGYDPYGNAVVADITRETATGGPANGGREIRDSWRVEPQGMGALDFSLVYTSGKPSWSTDEARPYSNVRPEFSRIYRYDQLVQLVMSSPLGKPLTGRFALASTIAALKGLFDGSEETIAILDVPVYVRKVTLP